MKKILVALGFALTATMANATIVGGLEVYNEATVAIDPSDTGWGPIYYGTGIAEAGYTEGKSGTMRAAADGLFTATYLGDVAAYNNFYMGGSTMYTEDFGQAIGSTASMNVTAGNDVAFGFGEADTASGLFINGDANTGFRGILFFENTYGLKDVGGNLFDFLVGYNDSASVNGDYDDYVVGVINTVPVPAALPLMASALGMFGVSRRKSKKQLN